MMLTWVQLPINQKVKKLLNFEAYLIVFCTSLVLLLLLDGIETKVFIGFIRVDVIVVCPIGLLYFSHVWNVCLKIYLFI